MPNTKPSSQSSDNKTQHRTTTVNHLGAIFREYGEQYIKQYSPDLAKIKLLRAIRICKSPALGGKAIVCKSCHNHHYIYHSCGHSHCPICQSIKREQWIDKLKNELLNVPYVHMVFTLPHQLKGIARNNKREIYSLILRSSWQTVKTLSVSPENIGGLPGMIAVLHTFGSDMKYHIHTHCLVTFGGFDEQSNKWIIPHRKDKIARYRHINSTYRSIFLEGLSKLYAEGKINYHLPYDEVYELVGDLSWVVHNTKPTVDTTILENYLARYINRVAVSNSKIDFIKDQQKVKLIYNDYAKQEEGKPAPKAHKLIDPLVFMDQFFQHVLPPYFAKCRRYGLHASATKKKYKDVLPETIKRNGYLIRTVFQILNQLLKEKPFKCEKCQSEHYDILEVRSNKEWVQRFINVPTPRPPPFKSKISCIQF